MRALAAGIRTDETSAGEIAIVADTIEPDGRFGEAEGLRIMVCNHGIRVVEAQEQLAGSSGVYETHRQR